ncbi:DUF397 domain-containing protein [Streptomyces sp. NPDC017529]|uniref:DUF397 domain-containing protein n=1 Tax=Streptomyces sp. NPDC017529 TaxID=3365000 RepID=UPI0037B406D9
MPGPRSCRTPTLVAGLPPADGGTVNTNPAWFKSGYSSTDGGECVEIATCPHVTYVRDSKDPQGPRLAVGADAWVAFLAYANACGGPATPA